MPAASVAASLALLALPAVSSASALAPFASPLAADGSPPAAPWAFAGLPGQRPPATRFSIRREGDQVVLAVEANASYGNLVHPLPGSRAGVLSWQWRVDKPLPAANLRKREGDDVALKVCAMFEMPREQVPFVERQLLRLAESRTGTALPNATLCYAFDSSWPTASLVPNAYTRRVRTITLGASRPGWQSERRDLAADFLRAFGDESPSVPPLLAIAVGADADNTGGHSLGAVTELMLQAPR